MRLLLFIIGISYAAFVEDKSWFSLLPEALAGNENSTCAATLISLLTTKLGTKKSRNLIAYSGKRINDMGEYKECKNSNESIYILAGIKLSTTGSIEIGFCFPSECTMDELSKLKEPLATIISILIHERVPPEAVFFSEVEKEIGKYGAGYFTFWGIVGLFTLLAIIGTYFDGMDKKLNDKTASIGWKMLKSFSLGRNLDWFFRSSNPLDPNLEIFNGIRCILMAWVIIGHSFTFELMTPSYNKQEIYNKIVKGYWYSFIRSGTLAVDSFFMISGFFAACSFFKVLEDKNLRTVGTILKAYLYRYFRLFPVVGLSIMMMTFIMPTLREFPYDPHGIKEAVQNCQKSWYMTLLYVNNFQDFKDVCMNWSWYLMIDMQLYVLAPLFVLSFLYSKVVGNIIIASVSIMSIITTAFIYSYNGLHASLGKGVNFEYFTLFYNKPYCRIIPYLMGILFFNQYTESRQGNMQKLNNFVSKGGKYILYAIGLILMYFSITVIYYFDNYPNSWSQGLATFHELAFRPTFIFGLICIIYPTISGYGKLLGNILGHPVFNPFAKLTYSMYMVHLIVIYVIMLHGVNGHYSTLFAMWLNSFIIISITLVISFFIFVLFENPLSQLNRVIILKYKPKREEVKLLINESVVKP